MEFGASMELGAWNLKLSTNPHPNLLRLAFAQREIVAANFYFNRIAEWREADELNRAAYEQTHFHQARTARGWQFDFCDCRSGAESERREWLRFGGHFSNGE